MFFLIKLWQCPVPPSIRHAAWQGCEFGRGTVAFSSEVETTSREENAST
jgi:hypothetical protein